MPRSYLPIKALTTAALLYFGYKISCYTADAVEFVWKVKIITHEDTDSACQDSDFEDLDSVDQDSVFEDLDTEHFPLPEKCSTPPHYELPPPYVDN